MCLSTETRSTLISPKMSALGGKCVIKVDLARLVYLPAIGEFWGEMRGLQPPPPLGWKIYPKRSFVTIFSSVTPALSGPNGGQKS